MAGFLAIAPAHGAHAAEPMWKSLSVFIADLHHHETARGTPFCRVSRDGMLKGSRES
jgi:hypothetical protein